MVGEPVSLLDTHVLVWWVNGERQRFPRQARQALEQHGKRRGRLRLKVPVTEWLASVRRLPELRLEPLTDDIAERAGQFGDAFAGDPAERLLAATALLRAVPLVTCDEELRESGLLTTIW